MCLPAQARPRSVAAMTTAAPAVPATAEAAVMALMGRARASGPVPYTGFRVHTRLCAAVTAASSLVHLGSVLENQHGPLLNAVMVAMAAVCLPCAVHVWNRA